MRNDLIQARKAKGLSQEQLAERVGKTQPVISRYESGQCAIDVNAAPELAKILGISIIAVLYGPQKKAA